MRYFIVFEDEGGGKLTKKMAGYHQFHAVNVAVEETLRAAELLRRIKVESCWVDMMTRSPEAIPATVALVLSGIPRAQAKA